MTDEEKKAIEFWQGQVELYSKEGRPRKTLQILLNLIENTQKEIEYWKDKFDKELDDNIEKTTKIMKKDNRIKELEKAVEKKDKVIRKMSERVYLKKEEYKCVRENQTRKLHKSFEDCIIEYFEKKER